MTGNEKLCKIYFKNLFFQNVFAFINLFISVISAQENTCVGVSFLIKLQAFGPATLSKRDFNACVPVKLAKFYEHLF